VLRCEQLRRCGMLEPRNGVPEANDMLETSSRNSKRYVQPREVLPA
jgi:hypothetical protein